MTDYQYSKENDTLNGTLNEYGLHRQIQSSDIVTALGGVTSSGDNITISFKQSLSLDDKAILDTLVSSHDGTITTPNDPDKVEISNTIVKTPFDNPQLDDGSQLYTKVHGLKETIPANGTHEFLFAIPYDVAFFQGAEILNNIVSVSDFKIKMPAAAGGAAIEQYGYAVNTGEIIYKRESKYVASLPLGFQISCEITNDESTPQEFGVNFILHEKRVM